MDHQAASPSFATRRPLQRRLEFASKGIRRLALLAGFPCPACGHATVFDGKRLVCSESFAGGCGYGWREADGAEDEVLCGIRR